MKNKKKKESTKIVVCFFPTQMLTHCYISFCRRDNRLTRTMNIWMWRFAKALPMALWHYLLIKRSLYLYDNFEAKTPTRETKRRKKSPSTEKLHEKVSAKYCRSHGKAWRTWKEWRQNKITKKKECCVYQPYKHIERESIRKSKKKTFTKNTEGKKAIQKKHVKLLRKLKQEWQQPETILSSVAYTASVEVHLPLCIGWAVVLLHVLRLLFGYFQMIFACFIFIRACLPICKSSTFCNHSASLENILFSVLNIEKQIC